MAESQHSKSTMTILVPLNNKTLFKIRITVFKILIEHVNTKTYH
jgi:hypothetical protein